MCHWAWRFCCLIVIWIVSPELKALHNGLLNMHSEAKGALNKLDDE